MEIIIMGQINLFKIDLSSYFYFLVYQVNQDLVIYNQKLVADYY